jgi:hypothetical protein
MCLARDVENAEGYRILARGTALSETQIALLEGWGVIDVLIEDAKAPVAAPQDAPADPAAPAAASEAAVRLKARFEGRLANNWMKALYAEAEKRLGSSPFWKC